MGVFTRPRSPYWHLWIEGAPPDQQRVNTKIRIGRSTDQRRDSRRLAEELYHRLVLQVAADRHRMVGPVAQARTVNQQLEWHRTTITPQHRGAEREREILKRLKKDFGSLALRQVDRAAVLQWMRQRLETVSASTVNRELDVLKAVLREAVPTYLASSPIYGLKRLRLTERPHRRVLEPADERRLLQALAPADRAIVIMGLDTLCRLRDILELRRQDDHGATLYIRAPKGGHAYSVPVSKRLRRALDAVRSIGDYYFPHRRHAKTDRDRRAAIRQLLARVCKRLRIPWGRSTGLTFHWATRRTGATRMIQAGVDVRTVQEIGNWKQPRILLEIYAESNARARQAAVEVVGRRRRRKSA